MKFLLKRICIICVLIIATLMSVTMQFSLIHKSKTLPNGIELSSKLGMNLSFNECDDNKIAETKVSAIAFQDSFIKTELSSYPQQVELALTNYTFDDIAPLNIRYGNYFQQNSIAELNRVIVISDQLAFKLFQKYDVVGQTATINNIEYTICGVYIKNQSILSRLSSSDKERVFIPYMSVLEYDKIPIKQLYIQDKETRFIQGMIDSIQLLTNKVIMYDDVTDFRNIKTLISQSLHVSVFILGLNIIAYLVYLCIKKAKSTYMHFATTINKKQLFINSGICFALIIGMIIVFIMIKFKVFVPTTMLPMDNVFDFKFYLDEIINMVQRKNGLSIYDFHWNYSLTLILSSTIASIISSILFVITWWYGVTVGREMYKTKY